MRLSTHTETLPRAKLNDTITLRIYMIMFSNSKDSVVLGTTDSPEEIPEPKTQQ